MGGRPNSGGGVVLLIWFGSLPTLDRDHVRSAEPAIAAGDVKTAWKAWIIQRQNQPTPKSFFLLRSGTYQFQGAYLLSQYILYY